MDDFHEEMEKQFWKLYGIACIITLSFAAGVILLIYALS